MKKTLITGYDRQHVAALLLAHLGPSMCWHHQLMDYSKKGTGLHGSGPTLCPVATDKGRPIYSHEAIYEFIELAKAHDASLGRHRPMPTMYEVPEAALAIRPYLAFRAVAVPTA